MIRDIIRPIIRNIIRGPTESVGAVVSFIEPDAIANLEAWYKASTIGVGDGNTVSTWADSSGNGRNLIAPAPNSPTFRATGGPDSNPAVDWNGIDQRLQAVFTLTQPEHVFIVFKGDTWTNNDSIMDGAVVNSGLLFQGASGTDYSVYAGTTLAAISLTTGTYYLAEVLFNGLNSTFIANGTTLGPAAAGSANMGGVTLGARGNSGFPADCHIAEYAVYSSEITGTDLTGLRAYFANKYPSI